MTHGASIDRLSPPWWLQGGHSQTLFRKFSPTESVKQKRERIELDDRDFIDLDWSADAPTGHEASETIVFILHGLCGCSGSSYIQSLQALLSKQGVSSVVMNFRGCSGEVNRKAKAYHSGASEDVNEVFTKFSTKYPSKNFVCIGFSLGANVMLKWLGEIGEHRRISKAAAVSTPFSLKYCSQAMLSGPSRIYGKYFVWRLVKELQTKLAVFEANRFEEELELLKSLGDFSSVKTLWEFDEAVTAPLNGFKHAEDYYHRCSSDKFLSAINTETLLIQSKNDPLIPPESVPAAQFLRSNIHLHLEDTGGHVGFFDGQREKWLENQLMRYLLD
ncbi:MAG: alpha/beta fold hydrolase [Gammaproteobacteria bacterium]|nr:alpha/beta fold hydrolase [Gammaproteobacteria bacterium]